ncbi:MAG: RluA family pseudouridine synthase [Bacilli bacterium]|nr:RluA family pseudouridine synthase [Bacilli bacterium]
MRLEYIVDVEEMMIKDYILSIGLSQRLAKKIKLYGNMSVNGLAVKNYEKVRRGDILVLEYDEMMNEDIKVNMEKVDILYEDECLLVVNKPVDLASQPSRKHQDDNLVSRLKGYFINKGITSNIHIVNRLDYSTSGLLIVAKTGNIHHQLTKDNNIKRKYLAIVEGKFIDKVGRISLPIARVEEYNIKRAVDYKGQEAITNYRVLKEKDDTSIVELCLETGRTHQIRVHLSYLGHPVLGDKLYGKENDRLYLHCFYLEFPHPLTNKIIKIENKPKWNV